MGLGDGHMNIVSGRRRHGNKNGNSPHPTERSAHEVHLEIENKKNNDPDLSAVIEGEDRRRIALLIDVSSASHVH